MVNLRVARHHLSCRSVLTGPLSPTTPGFPSPLHPCLLSLSLQLSGHPKSSAAGSGESLSPCVRASPEPGAGCACPAGAECVYIWGGPAEEVEPRAPGGREEGLAEPPPAPTLPHPPPPTPGPRIQHDLPPPAPLLFALESRFRRVEREPGARRRVYALLGVGRPGWHRHLSGQAGRTDRSGGGGDSGIPYPEKGGSNWEESSPTTKEEGA